jgi:hypothetical protein
MLPSETSVLVRVTQRHISEDGIPLLNFVRAFFLYIILVIHNL